MTGTAPTGPPPSPGPGLAQGFRRLLEIAFRGGTLGREGAREAMGHLVSGAVPEAQVAGFLGALASRGVSPEELAGFVEAMRERAVTVTVRRRPLIDTCGTGGDGLSTFNFSTAAALVAAGAGAAVAKHGNRAVSSRSGSADVLEALGVAVDPGPEEARASIEEEGFGFLFAPRFHPAAKSVAGVRRALGVRTVFNLLGPLVNPARVPRQVMGLYDPALQETVARVLDRLGLERALVVCGSDGMDELTLCGETRIFRAEGGRVWSETATPESAGLPRAESALLKGEGAAENAALIVGVLEGRSDDARSRALLDGTLLNAGAALLAAGLCEDLRAGVELSRESVRSGRARGVLEALRRRALRRPSP